VLSRPQAWMALDSDGRDFSLPIAVAGDHGDAGVGGTGRCGGGCWAPSVARLKWLKGLRLAKVGAEFIRKSVRGDQR